jgi:hypothetical protein
MFNAKNKLNSKENDSGNKVRSTSLDIKGN